MLGVPVGTDLDEAGAGDGCNKNKDDLYLFTRGQVFKKSSRRPSSSVLSRMSSFPVPSPAIVKMSLPSPFVGYADPGFDAAATVTGGLIFSGHHQDGFVSYAPAMDLFSLEAGTPDQLSMFGSGGTTTGEHHHQHQHHHHESSSSWLQQFGITDAFAR
jgi:hypothetical protein